MRRRSNKSRGRKATELSLKKVRSAITNGSCLFTNIDGRSAPMRRFRDVIAAHEADLGGRDHPSEGQRAIVRRAALLQLSLEALEQKFASRPDGNATCAELETYQRASGALRRLIESLGLNVGRKPRTVSSNDHLGRLIDGVVKESRRARMSP
jgi:hypothetical protein